MSFNIILNVMYMQYKVYGTDLLPRVEVWHCVNKTCGVKENYCFNSAWNSSVTIL